MNRFALILAFTASFGVAGAARAQTAHLAGAVVDPSDALLPGATVTVEHVDPAQRSTTTVKTDRTGRYEFTSLASGSYTLSVSVPGFETFRAPVTLASGDDVERNVMLQIGTLQETITVTTGDTPTPYRADTPRTAPPPPPPPPPAAPGALRVGGNIKAPTKIKDVRPVYPVALASQGAEGTVSLVATIGGDGYVRDTDVLSSPNDDFSRAASDAVSQWVFTPTLLNGQPVDVKMKVNVYFKTN